MTDEPEPDTDVHVPDKRAASMLPDALAQGDTKRLSLTLYVAAWVVEGLAVFTGLAISLMMALDAFDQVMAAKGKATQTDYVNIVAATLPFLLVAVVEFTKIPVAGAAYSAPSRIWRLVFGMTLVFLAFITFETMLNGFERNFSNLTSGVSNLQKEKVLLYEEIEDLEERRREASELTLEKIERAYTERRNELAADRDTANKQILDQRVSLLSTVQDEYSKTLRDELENLKGDREVLAARREKELDRLNLRIDGAIEIRDVKERGQRTTLVDRIETLDVSIAKALEGKRDAIRRATFLFSNQKQIDQYDQEISDSRKERERRRSELDDLGNSSPSPELQALRASVEATTRKFQSDYQELSEKIEAKGREIAEATSLKQKDIQPSLDRYDNDLKKIETKFSVQQALNSEHRKQRLDLLTKKGEEISTLTAQLVQKKGDLTALRNRINKQVGANQVYRLAVRFSRAESAADLNPTAVTWVAAIWFGSLAAVVSLTGILLALASYVAGDRSKVPPRSRRTTTRGLLASVRRLFVSLRRRAFAPRVVYRDREVPVEVVREIPVEKVSIKEVPREVVVKEIVHVPMYTNDPDLIGLKGKSRASAADSK
jgi:hypothetical protein